MIFEKYVIDLKLEKNMKAQAVLNTLHMDNKKKHILS